MHVPEVIKLLDTVFVVAGAIFYFPPVVDDDIGHNVCAIKINNQWEIYNDKDSKSPKNISSKANGRKPYSEKIIVDET